MVKIKGFHDDLEKQGSLVRDINKKKIADAFSIKKVKISKDSSFKQYYEEKYNNEANK